MFLSGQWRDRVLLSVTARGRKVVKLWLDEPVAHLRDVRTELLIELALRARVGLDPAPLLTAQIAAVHRGDDRQGGMTDRASLIPKCALPRQKVLRRVKARLSSVEC